MKTKIKKRIVSIAAFMSLVVSLVGVLPLMPVQAATHSVHATVQKYYNYTIEENKGIHDIYTYAVTSQDIIDQVSFLASPDKGYYMCAFISTSQLTCSVNEKKWNEEESTKYSLDVSQFVVGGKTYYYCYSSWLFGKSDPPYYTFKDQFTRYTFDQNLLDEKKIGDLIKNYVEFKNSGDNKYNFSASTDLDGAVVKPYFYLASSQAKRNSVLSSYYNCKWALTWKLPDNVDMSGYFLDVCVSNNATKGDKVSICDASKQTIPVSKKYYSFWTNPQVRDAMMSCWSDWRPNKKNVFYVYARVKNKSGVASDWTIFQCYPNGTIGTVYGRSDANWDKTEEFKGETGSYSDGTKTDANGSYYVPDSGYDPSGETDDSGYKKDYSWKDDVSGADNGTIDKSSFMGLLNDCINSIGNVPAILSQLVPWIPDDIISLICVAFGFIVVVGVIKWVL